MKAASQGTGISRAEDKLKSFDCYNANPSCSLGITLVQDIPLPNDAKGPVKKEVDRQDGDGPAQILSWLANAHKHFAPKFGAVDIEELEGMISLYLAKVTSCISKCYVPNRAAKMKRCIGDILLFFNIHYREVPEMKKTYSTYLDKMTELMAYYIDMEIQASSRAKEAPQAIASKLTLSLYTFLDKSHDHILDSILKANNMNKNFWELCSLLFSGVLKDTPNRILSDLTYVRYILVYKMWKRVVQGPEERKKVMTLASLRLKHPPHFVEKTRAGFLNGIVPKIPKKRPDVTTFLIQAKFDVKEKAKAFLKYIVECKTNVLFVPTVPAIKTDIPLLVGHLPDFGPSPNLVKLEPPEIEEDDPENVDISGSRLMNEVWTSVNHEASFREAIRMQNVTSFSKIDTKLAERKKMQRVLKQRKGRVNNSVVSKARPGTALTVTSQRHDVTIVVSDDSEVSDVEKDVVFPPVHVEKVGKTTRKLLEPKRKLKSSIKPNKKIQRDPTPPPVIEPAKSPTRPSQNGCILTPSQIKREMHDDVDDVIILDLPVPGKCDSIAKETHESRNTGTNCAKVEIQEKTFAAGRRNPVDDKTTRGGVVTDTLRNLKEERLSPTKEDEVNMRLHRDLMEHIKFSGDFPNGSTCDQVVKPLESPSLEVEKKTDMNIGSSKSVSGLEKKGKEDGVRFDDEASTWSPSEGNEEFIERVVSNFGSTYPPNNEVDFGSVEGNGGVTNFISPYRPDNEVDNRSVEGNGVEMNFTPTCPPDNEVDNRSVEGNGVVINFTPTCPPDNEVENRLEEVNRVVTNFISTCLPDDEVDNRLVEGNVPSEYSVRNQAVDDEIVAFESTPVPNSAEESPPAKRSRVEGAGEDSSVRPTSAEESSPARVSESSQALASHSDESTPQIAGEGLSEQVTNSAKRTLHAVTLQYHHSCYVEQAKFRDLCTTFKVQPEDEIPTPYFNDPATGQLTQGCVCVQCTANYTALCSNVKCLVDFKASTLLNIEKELASAESSNAVDENQFEERHDEQAESVAQDGVDPDTGEFSGAGGETSVQLPFKKRKAFSGDGESQHSDASREEPTEPTELRPWPDEYPSHTPTRMFSIAALDDLTATSQACPPLSVTFPCAPSTSAMANPGEFSPGRDAGYALSTSAMANPGEFSPGRDAGYLPAPQFTGGGFPPFSSVVPPETRPQPSYGTVEIPIPQDPPAFPSYHHQPQSDPDFGRRLFRTPAELKATFHAEPAPAQVSPWNQDLVNAAYFTRSVGNTSSALVPETKRRSRKDSSSRKSKSSKKRK